MKKILLIQSRLSEKMIRAEHDGYSSILNQHSIDPVSSLHDSHDWNNPSNWIDKYDAVIFGGSGDLDFDGGRQIDDEARVTSKMLADKLRRFVSYLLEKDFPTLGICYGHQLISECVGVPVVNDHQQKKVGTHEVYLTADGLADKIFTGMSEKFNAQYGHKDSLSDLPKGAILLASGTRCRASALRFGNNVYTMQFHPELTAHDVRWKLQHSPGYLPDGVNLEELVKESKEASKIIPNFINNLA